MTIRAASTHDAPDRRGRRGHDDRGARERDGRGGLDRRHRRKPRIAGRRGVAAENATGTTLTDLYLTDAAFGVWVNGADQVTIADSRIEGTQAPRFANRGNGINLWETNGTEVRNTEITDVRDGIYYSWASNVEATGNTMWDLRYGVHYMYSDDNRLADNVAFENDVGYALMVSESIELVNNTAVANRGESGHGILLKEIDRSVVRDNTLVANDNGVFLYNAQDNEVRGNLLYANGVGVHHPRARRGRSSPATAS